MPVARRSASPAPASFFDTLESRQLLATGFNPDGPVISTPSETPSSVITADFDGDAKPDLVTAVGRDILFQKGGGGGKFGVPRLLARLNTNVGILAAGDFNADGLADLFSVEKQTFNGWRRLLINSGGANFAIASYGRVSTLVETVTVGSIDFDAQDEVLIEGTSPWLVLGENKIASIIGTPPDEIRVLDPVFIFIPVPFVNSAIASAAIRLADRGITAQGQNLAQPVIAPLFASDTSLPAVNNIIVGGQDSTDPATGFVRVYVYSTPFLPVPGPGPFFDDIGVFTEVAAPIAVGAPVTSVAAADMTGDFKPDLVVTTLLATPSPSIPDFDPVGQSEYQARTLMFPRIVDANATMFDAPVTLESRTLSLRPGTRRALAPDYRIVGVADFNSDGFNDVGLSVVQEFVGGRNGNVRDAGFVQLIRPDITTLPPPGGAYFSSFVSRTITTGVAPEAIFSRPQLFTLGDVRRTGRPDLLVVSTPRGDAPATITILFNVQGRALVPFPFDDARYS